MRKCLSKRAGDRPTATEALELKFISRSLTELNWLYEDLVLKSWVSKYKHHGISKTVDSREEEPENIFPETGEVMEDLSQMALCEIDVNGLDGRQKKRGIMAVDGCNQENEGVNDRRKRRRVVS